LKNACVSLSKQKVPIHTEEKQAYKSELAKWRKLMHEMEQIMEDTCSKANIPYDRPTAPAAEDDPDNEDEDERSHGDSLDPDDRISAIHEAVKEDPDPVSLAAYVYSIITPLKSLEMAEQRAITSSIVGYSVPTAAELARYLPPAILPSTIRADIYSVPLHPNTKPEAAMNQYHSNIMNTLPSSPIAAVVTHILTTMEAIKLAIAYKSSNEDQKKEFKRLAFAHATGMKHWTSEVAAGEKNKYIRGLNKRMTRVGRLHRMYKIVSQPNQAPRIVS
jgi:hypothetical protein